MHNSGGMGGPMMVGNVQQRMQMQQMGQMNPNMQQRMMRPGVNVQGGLRQILQQPQQQQQQFQQQRMSGGSMMPMNQQMGQQGGPRAPQQGDSLRNMLG